MNDELQKRMFREMEQKQLFDKARDAAYAYADSASQRKVFPDSSALEKLTVFEEPLAEEPFDALEILSLLDEFGSPASVAQIGGRYFGLVNGGVIPVALAARWLADFWDQNTPLYLSSPIASKLEEVSEAWLRDLFGLPATTVAGFVSGSSMAIFCGLAAARYRIFERLGWDINRRGLRGSPAIRVIASAQAHGTVSKAIALLGIGLDNVEWVDADAQGRIDPQQLPELDATCIVVLQAGNVNSGAFDDFETICSLARQVNAWVHIDGAFGLWAAASRLKALTLGIDKADSWSADAHKTLNTPYDNGLILCSDREALVQALQARGSYIVYGEQRDGMLFTPEMSRRARVVELWAALKYLGKSGVDELVYGLHRRACQFADELSQQGFTILNDVVFNQVLVACEDEAITVASTLNIQQSGECWVGGSRWQNRQVIRVSVCSWATTEEDITRSVAAFVLARDKARVAL